MKTNLTISFIYYPILCVLMSFVNPIFFISVAGAYPHLVSTDTRGYILGGLLSIIVSFVLSLVSIFPSICLVRKINDKEHAKGLAFFLSMVPTLVHFIVSSLIFIQILHFNGLMLLSQFNLASLIIFFYLYSKLKYKTSSN